MSTVLRFPLHDVADVPALVQRILADYCSKRNWHCPAGDREDLVQELVTKAWWLGSPTNPGRWQRSKGFRTFSSYLYWKLPRVIIDFKRRQYGDARHGLALTKQPLGSDTVLDLSGIEDVVYAIDADRLTPEARRTFEHVILPITVNGATLEELSNEHGVSRKLLSQRAKRALPELLEQLEMAA